MAAPAASPASHAAAASPLQDAINAINHFLSISLKVGDIAQDEAGAAKIADSDNRDERVTGIRERAAADHDGDIAAANATPAAHTKPKGQQAHEQDD